MIPYRMMLNKDGPVNPSERFVILDVLRGIALLGICLANYQEFSLYTFQDKAVVEAMPTARIDHIWKYFHYIFIEGKFYSLFSLLFGIGFSIILSKITEKKTYGFAVFYRRMMILAIIGFMHLILLWAGDIVLLYALVGLFLPLFRNVSNKKLLIISAALLLFPIALDTFKMLTDHRFTLMIPVEKALQYFNAKNGINSDNFSLWLLEGKSYSDVLKFNLSGAFIRCQEFIEGSRVFKVLGLFILGLYVGRNRIYARLNDYAVMLKKTKKYGFLIGLPFSCLFAWNVVDGHWGLIAGSTIYALSVVPLSLAYISSVCLWYMKHQDKKIFTVMAAPGRMALTNYIGQSAIGMLLFYGIGFTLALTGLVYVELIAVGAFLFQVLCSNVWLHYFRFGPLEWIWRMFTYGKWLKISKDGARSSVQS